MPSILATGAWLGMAVAGLAIPILAAASGHQFRSPVRMVFYGLLPLGVFATATWMLRQPRARRVFPAYCAALIAMSIAIVQIVLQARALRLDRNELAGDQRAARVAAQLRESGERAYPQLCGGNLYGVGVSVDGDRIVPLTGPSHNLLVRNDYGTESRRRSDRFGFNNPVGQWIPGETEILLVGDSYAYGADIPFGQSFADRLRDRLALPTLNLGCEGNGPLLELASLVEYGPVARPRRVLWLFYEGNDLSSDLPRELRWEALRRYLEPGHRTGLPGMQAELDAALVAHLDAAIAARNAASGAPEREPWSWRQTLTMDHLRRAIGLTWFEHKPETLEVFRRVLIRAIAETESWGGSLTFVLLPGNARYSSRIGAWDADAYAQPVIELARSLGLPVIDIAAELGRQPDPHGLYWGHFSAEGNAIVADLLAQALATQQEGSLRLR